HVLDAANGKRLWSWSTDKDDALKGKASLSCPILAPEGLFTLAIATEGSRTATLLAFDRESGDGGPRWKRVLATVPAAASPWNAFQRDPDAILAYADGAVVVATNLGVVAAVDASSGDLLWTYSYGLPGAGGHVNAPNNSLDSRRVNPPPSWVVAADGVVCFGAADTSDVWAIDPRSGRKVFNNDVPSDASPAGYGGGILYLAGSKFAAFEVWTGKRAWFLLPGTYARAAVAANGCLCWGNRSLSFRRNEDGAEFDGYDWASTEGAKDERPEPGGAILPLGDRILLQARGRLYCFRLEDPVPPPEDLPERIAGWIAGLSSPTYAVRHSAAESLLEAGAAAKAGLEAAKASSDREVSWRAEEVLKAMQESHLLVRRPPKKDK
ncbi:MAG: PQQ-binding-like beta-propeller repeat protein, partial [Planctomycetota bacterium]